MRDALARIREFVLDPRVVDAMLALGLSVVSLLSMAGAGAFPGYRPLDALGVAIALATTLPIAVRRRQPLAVLIITGIGTVALGVLGYNQAAGLPVLFALYTVAAHTDRSTSILALRYTAVGILVSIVLQAGELDLRLANLVSTYVVFGTVWLIGENLRGRRDHVAQLEERARLLEREREENARLAVAEERTRIARELHDVVAHHVSVMVVQAGGARRVLGQRPDEAREAMEAVEATGRQALTEMRRLVGVLRAADGRDDHQPQPSLDRLEELIGQMRDAGLPVELVIEGARRGLPAGVDLSAYRIVQEALTNALKHAGRASSTVRLHYGRNALDIEVTDDGRGAAADLADPDHRGHGLIGMRERVALFGGRLEAGPRMTGGYAVSAHLPLDGA